MNLLVVLAQGIVDNSANTQCDTPPCPNTLQDFESVFASILAAIIPLAGIVLFVVVMLAGFNWMTAGSDTKKAESARNMATYGIIGITTLALSFLILRVIASFTGIESLLNFQIFQP